ncbi:MAG: enoyl-CoA hydratase/isomerase family protein [Rhizobiaceae bacterium]|nr:enoyl-CoA hydratase/isomerase family protein [Rhizobiaceae bacterium]MCV0408990.1 enoyl-CoA hydratase/isomerase family protein [Rhizobiaceae bacterium]
MHRRRTGRRHAPGGGVMRDRSLPVRSVLADREMELGPDEVISTTDHWTLKKGADGIAWLILDRKDESANTLSEDVIVELDRMLSEVEGLRPKGLAIRSAKTGGFAAGADIRDFRGVTDAAEIEERMREAHRVIDRLAALPFPTIAIVHGHCLGGGLELALACDRRIAVHGAKLGFPEVMLGLHPGLGGTFRLTGLIDPIEAMTMMLTGKSAHDRKAKRLGLVDELVQERHVDSAVRAAVNSGKPKRGHGLKGQALSFGPARKLAAGRMRAETEKRAPEEHYPAPYRLIELWEEHGGDPREMRKGEIRSFSRLLAGETAQNLIRVFFLREKLRSLAKGESRVKHVHVIGAGAMGGDIAAWAAAQGLTVSLTDLDPKALAKAVGRAAAFYDKKLHSGIERRDALDRLVPDIAGDGAARAHIVIEAVAEKAEVKKKVYAGIAPRMKPDAILATNTSSIPLSELAEGLPFPERLVGVHFFNPVTRMELVEIVSHDKASDEALARARAFCGDISRLPAPVKSAPGFLVNRALTPYLVEAFVMLDEGVAKETLDRAARDFGMPMGPIELADQVGLDIGLSVAESLRAALDDPMPGVPGWLRDKVEKGDLGRKTGKGLYEYDKDGKPRKDKDAPSPEPGMADRLIMPMLNTCARLLREEVVTDADTLDAAMIFGTGFAPFRGGPMHYARSRGVDDVVATLKALEERHGARFSPDEGWEAVRAE